MSSKIKWILKGLKAERTNTVLSIFLFVVQAAVLSMIIMFSGGDRITEALANTVHLDLAYRNEFLASPNYSPDIKQGDPYRSIHEFTELDPEGYYTYFSMLKNGLRELGQSTDVSYYNFNITAMVRTPGLKRGAGDDPPGHLDIVFDTVFGIEDFSFFEVNDIGFESCSSSELSEDSLFVPLGSQIRLSDGTLRPVKLGDSVELIGPSDSKRHTFTIQGIYNDGFRFDYSYGFDDRFVNSSGIVVANISIEKYLLDANDLRTLRSMQLNHPTYRLSHYSRFDSFVHRMDKIVSDLESFARYNGYNDPQLKVQRSGTLKTLEGIKGAAALYSGVLTVVELMLTVLLSGFLYYLVSKKKRELVIFYSLGERKCGVGLRNSMYFGATGAVGALIGCVPGYFLCKMLSDTVVRNSLRIQSELLRYSYYGRTMIKTLYQIGVSELGAGAVVKYALFTVLITLIITAVISFISTFALLRGNVRESIAGGN